MLEVKTMQFFSFFVFVAVIVLFCFVFSENLHKKKDVLNHVQIIGQIISLSPITVPEVLGHLMKFTQGRLKYT